MECLAFPSGVQRSGLALHRHSSCSFRLQKGPRKDCVEGAEDKEPPARRGPKSCDLCPLCGRAKGPAEPAAPVSPRPSSSWGSQGPSQTSAEVPARSLCCSPADPSGAGSLEPHGTGSLRPRSTGSLEPRGTECGMHSGAGDGGRGRSRDVLYKTNYTTRTWR